MMVIFDRLVLSAVCRGMDTPDDIPDLSPKQKEQAARAARKVQALRDNLRRRKTSVKNRKV